MKCTTHPEASATGMCTYCGKPFCNDCLVEVDGKMVCRNDVTRLLQDAQKEAEKSRDQTPVQIYNTNVNTQEQIQQSGGFAGPRKSKLVALLLCIFLGYFGAHRFYLGKTGSAVIYLLTCGGMYIGWLVDIVLILTNNLTDSYGQPLV